MGAEEKKNPISPPTPELPVADVERAQQYYRDALGFEIGWLYPDKGIGAVWRDRAVIFFRRREPPFEPAVHWVFAEDVDAWYRELSSSGANIVEPLEKKPWGLRQFTVEDLDGNLSISTWVRIVNREFIGRSGGAVVQRDWRREE